jgi:hypothetical protein
MTLACLLPIFALALLPNEKQSLKLEEMLTKAVEKQSGTLDHLECGSYYDGISCQAQITYLHSGQSLICANNYVYRGGEKFWLIDSQCQPQ